MRKKFSIGIYFLFCMAILSPAQEILSPLQYNPVKLPYEDSVFTKKDQLLSPLKLPFREDFSYPGPYPDSKLWLDRFVFVNQGFAIQPKTLGTATFDALNEFGKIYKHAEENTYQFAADKLTSQPIRLDSVFEPVPMALSISDSILLTFYYQPQGTGSAPRQRDSLVVEFLHTPAHMGPDPNDENSLIWLDDFWVSVWRAEGEDLSSFVKNNNGEYFKRATIYIDEPAYLRINFQFRFRNYASFPLTKTPNNFAGNTNIWNVDYINLDYGRTTSDPFYYDIAFASPAQSVLRDYQSMPWSHYIANAQSRHRSSFDVSITNLDNITYNYTYRYFITDENNNIIRNYSGGTWNIAPFHTQGYQSYLPHANPPLAPNPFGLLTPAPARKFNVYHVVRQGNTGDNLTRNDTIMFRQVFDNYFAYDDGTPENGYGLVGFNSKGAVRFVLGHEDKLESVQFYFNSTLYNQNTKSFLIKVWKNLDPEIVLYQSEVHTVEFGQWLNQFVEYPIDPPLTVSDTIYVGWQQLSNDFLNIGFDETNNASANIYYNSHGQWLPTIYQGALMIRPVFGPKFFTNTSEEKPTSSLVVYPNPVKGNIINIQKPYEMVSDFEIAIFDATGKMVSTFQNKTLLDVSGLTNGIYFIRLKTPNDNHIESSRFIIAR